MKNWLGAAAFAFILAISAPAGLATAAARPSIQPADWAAYKLAFVGSEGRVIDTGNGGISHSEGQGYGLLLAYLANDPATFNQIWSFTRTEFLLRDDGLAMWRWDPQSNPHITDPNNATDGDILIAYALALAGRDWSRSELTEAATHIARAVGTLIEKHQGRTIMLPGKAGYRADTRKDGPVVNLSYWVFEALPILSKLAPETDWHSLSESGMTLLKQAAFGPRQLPSEWISLRNRPRPADGFAVEFGYNSFRIPLYLARAGLTDKTILARLRDGMTNKDGQVGIVDLDSGTIKQVLLDPGYAIIPAIVSCILEKTPVAENTRTFAPTLYYPSTLHLLALSYLVANHPDCLK